MFTTLHFMVSGTFEAIATTEMNIIANSRHTHITVIIELFTHQFACARDVCLENRGDAEWKTKQFYLTDCLSVCRDQKFFAFTLCFSDSHIEIIIYFFLVKLRLLAELNQLSYVCSSKGMLATLPWNRRETFRKVYSNRNEMPSLQKCSDCAIHCKS